MTTEIPSIELRSAIRELFIHGCRKDNVMQIRSTWFDLVSRTQMLNSCQNIRLHSCDHCGSSFSLRACQLWRGLWNENLPLPAAQVWYENLSGVVSCPENI